MPKHPGGMSKKKSIGTAWERIQYARARKVRGNGLTPYTARRQYFGRARPVVPYNTEISNQKNFISEERMEELVDALAKKLQ
ncbi:hypothetical protein C4577_01920 [Candidatus Parcubacteria bacterium]|nr:MAG: hypothetical protein C4577_01920 [Candidatus Parcubacteria bacterium]